jgi:hypothetical protein
MISIVRGLGDVVSGAAFCATALLERPSAAITIKILKTSTILIVDRSGKVFTLVSSRSATAGR